MYSPLEILLKSSPSSTSLSSNSSSASLKQSKGSKFRSTNGHASRRILSCRSHRLCRLPLVILATVLFICVIYKIICHIHLNRTRGHHRILTAPLHYQPYKLPETSTTQNKNVAREKIDNPVITSVTPTLGPLGHNITDFGGFNRNEIEQITDEHNNVIPTESATTRTFRSSSSSTRPPERDFGRDSKVFILIIEDELVGHHNSILDSQRYSFPAPSKTRKYSNLGYKQVQVAPHIENVIEILNAHRIEYAIDSTRYGLPTQLLADQDDRQFSVIIVDNFMKYSRLSRWIRDQLDRHCKVNQIGVITYLAHDTPEAKIHDIAQSYQHHVLAQRSISSSTTSASISEQFPLVLKPISNQCRNSSSHDCLVDYQLNEKASILRILKRRPDFVLKGELPANINDQPWIAMSSNHVTYEALTWAKARTTTSAAAVLVQTNKRERRHALMREFIRHDRTLSPHRVTQQKNQKNAQFVERDKRGSLAVGSRESAAPSDILHDEYKLDENQRDELPASREQEFQSDLMQIHDFTKAPPLSQQNPLTDSDFVDSKHVLAMLDRGLYDGVRRVIFGVANHHWLDRLLLLDSIEHLSGGRIITPLDRYIQIDIDDIFVGETGIRLKESDVAALVATQSKFAKLIEGGFKFNLGFSGKYFKHGNGAENRGDQKLIEESNKFTWFCHFWSHAKAHLFNSTESLRVELESNLKFARDHNLTIIGQEGVDLGASAHLPRATYAVAPHHSGVYPIHEQLYDAWRLVTNVQVTSTEEYPRLKLAAGRRAFVHKSIKVLPRQTCGLYTHTIYRRKYPGGFGRLLAMIKGGELFQTVLHNPINIYMTHMSNYANDRLAPLAFGTLIEFVQANTNLRLRYEPTDSHQLGPMKLADHYFSLFPSERQPIWTNPCQDKRHLAIWARGKAERYCSVVPKILIVGPQKTGTTALYTFMRLNKWFKSAAVDTKGDFEEVQFFNDKHYSEGVDWYFEKFAAGTRNGREHEMHSRSVDSDGDLQQPQVESDDVEETGDSEVGGDVSTSFSTLDDDDAREHFYFDKSATYFDDPNAPQRASALLPDANVIILLIDPADRAYSWYEHMRAHGDSAATSLSFDDLIMQPNHQMTNETSSSERVRVSARALRSRCLHPGYYSNHIVKWLHHFPANQIIIIDGQWLRLNPVAVMNKLQLVLLGNQREKHLDYSRLLEFDERKGFYCHRASPSGAKSLRCLGPGKGRRYPPMSDKARDYLNRHYLAYNQQLAHLLADIGQPLPDWLEMAVSPLKRRRKTSSSSEMAQPRAAWL